jgi:hypothetical protein
MCRGRAIAGVRRKAVVSLLSSALPVRTQWTSKSESPGGMSRILADYESVSRYSKRAPAATWTTVV